jgi:hypothetical protein
MNKNVAVWHDWAALVGWPGTLTMHLWNREQMVTVVNEIWDRTVNDCDRLRAHLMQPSACVSYLKTRTKT